MNKKMRHIDFSFGASLRNAREKRNYRREQIAERAEISPRFLAAIESGRRKPSLDVLIRPTMQSARSGAVARPD